MRITYINHASLLVETADFKIVTDPWFAGGAYSNQWHPFPKPVNVELVDQADAIFLSHAHEDHLHVNSLVLLEKSKRVFYPFNWYGGTVDWIRSLGFNDVTEATSCHTYNLGGGKTRVTYVVNGHDSIMVFEDGDEVMVNVNDALHSYEPSVIDTFTDYLRQRWPRIDIVFCGFGGASYYPNTIHGPGKDDREVAWLREQLFAHNFCRIVSRLAPRIAVPFAADFALLADEQRWINEVRFPREWLPQYFHEQGGKSEIVPMYSGDRFVNGRLEMLSPYRDRIDDGGFRSLLDEQYPKVESALLAERPFELGKVEGLRLNLERSVNDQARFYEQARMEGLRFSLRLRDVPESSWFNIHFDQKAGAKVSRASQPDDKRVVEIETTAKVLKMCLESEWGGDAIIIGYACDVRVMRAEDLRKGVGKLCTELCVRHPRPKAYAMRNPLRVARFIAQTPFTFKAQLRQRANNLFRPQVSLINGSHWLSGTSQEIRSICGLPECTPP